MPRLLRHGLFALAALTVLALSGPVAADPPTLPPFLDRVPPDAAIFGHVDVAAVWNSKLGESARSAKARDLDKALAELKEKTGITPDMVKAVSFFFPSLKQPADFQSGVVHVTFTRPYDRARLVEFLKKNQPAGRFQEVQPGVYEIRGRDEKEAELTFDLTNPVAITYTGKGSRKYLTGKPDAPGPLSPAIKAAQSGATGTLGVNFAAMPDEIRGDDIPAEVRPFQPLFRSEAMIATARLTGEMIKLEVRFRNQEKTKTADAEKSLAAAVTLMQTALSAALKELENPNAGEAKSLLPLARQALETLKTVRVSVEENEAVASATVTTDLLVAPLLQQLFGGQAGASGRLTAQNNLKQIGLAMHNYHDTYNGFPPAAIVDRKGKPMLSWRVMILPYIEQDALYREFKLDEPWDSEHNKKVLEKHPMPPVFAIPGVTKEGEKNTHIQVFVGNGALFDPIQAVKIVGITDGTSNTIMAVTAAKAVPWTKPDDLPFDPKVDPRTLLLIRDNGCNVLFADGSVRFLAKTIAEETLKALITKSGGEVINEIP